MARPSKLNTIPAECYTKYHFLTADIIDILRMDIHQFQHVHPVIFEMFSSPQYSNATTGLLYYIPYHLLENMTPLQISAISSKFIEHLPKSVLEKLYEKYKDVHDVDYHEDMYYTLQNSDIGTVLKRAYEKPIKKDNFQYEIFSTEKDIDFYKTTHIISLLDIHILINCVSWFYRKGKSFQILLNNIKQFEISPKNNAFYLLISESEANKLYNYNEIKNYLKTNYTSCSSRFFDEIPYFCSYGEIFMRLINKGYFTTLSNGLEKELYNYFRYAEFPHLKIQGELGVIKRYIFEEIEFYIQEFLKNGTIPEETPKKRQINKLDYSNSSLKKLEYLNSLDLFQ